MTTVQFELRYFHTYDIEYRDSLRKRQAIALSDPRVENL